MNVEELNIIIFVTGIIIGCISTVAFKRLSTLKAGKSVTSNSDLLTMKSLQQELDNKQITIDNFFFDSNEQIMMLEKNLEKLKNNFSDNAKQLSNINIETNKHGTEEIELNSVVAPKDYALKTDKEEGMLSESFSLDEKSETIEPKRTI